MAKNKESNSYEVASSILCNVDVKFIYDSLNKNEKLIFDLINEYDLEKELTHKNFVMFCSEKGITRRIAEFNLNKLQNKKLITRFRHNGKYYILPNISYNDVLNSLIIYEILSLHVDSEIGINDKTYADKKIKNMCISPKTMCISSVFCKKWIDFKKNMCISPKTMCISSNSAYFDTKMVTKEKCTRKREKCTRTSEKCTCKMEKCTRKREKCTWAWKWLDCDIDIECLVSMGWLIRAISYCYLDSFKNIKSCLKKIGTVQKNTGDHFLSRLLYNIYLYILYKARMGGVGGKGREYNFEMLDKNLSCVKKIRDTILNLYSGYEKIENDISVEKLYKFSVKFFYFIGYDEYISNLFYIHKNNLPVLLSDFLDMNPYTVFNIITECNER